MVKIVTYNVNGIRAAISKGFYQWLEIQHPDVICIQETKASAGQVDTSMLERLGYRHYWFSAEKPGYSGVAVFTRIAPENVVTGCDNPLYDREGRFIRLDFKGFSVCSVYHPSGTTGEERQAFKMQWLSYFSAYIEKLKQEIPNLVLCGDYNICREAIDIHDPVSNKNSSGFLPEEREWFASFISSGLADSFRLLNPDPHHYTWWSYRANARARNKGWRIDYIMLTEALVPRLKAAQILPDAMHSDHCPMYVLMDLEEESMVP